MILETERLIIRPLNINDKEDLFYYRSDKETNKHQGWIPKSMEEVVRFIENLPQKINTPESWFQFAIVEKKSHQLIGDIGIHFFGKENLQSEIGCTLHKEFQGFGFASESLRSVINYLFLKLNKHRIIASIDPDNIASVKLVERIGFSKEAHFKESLFVDGKWVDDMVFALLKKDWK